MMDRGCSPLGPVPVPPTPGSGPAAAGMPLGWTPGLSFASLGGFGGGVATGRNRDLRALASEVVPGGRSALGALAFGPFVAASVSGIQAPRAPVGGSAFVVNSIVSASISMAGNSGTSISVSAPGVLATDSVSVAPTASFGDMGFGPLFAVAGGGTVTVYFVNCTTTTKNIAPGWTMRIGIIR